MRKSCPRWGVFVLISLAAGPPQRALAEGPYKVSKVVKIGGEGTFDTAFADVEGRRLYIPRKGPGRITVDKGGRCSGLAIDVKNEILFAGCRAPQMLVILSATDGKILDALPIGSTADSAIFNPETNEAYSAQIDGTLTIIKEESPTSFTKEQTVQTKDSAKQMVWNSSPPTSGRRRGGPMPGGTRVPPPRYTPCTSLVKGISSTTAATSRLSPSA